MSDTYPFVGPDLIRAKASSDPAASCTTCIALLAEASRLAKRAQDLDIDVEHARHIGKGCATPALAILNKYDADLERWQSGVKDHLQLHAAANGNLLLPADLAGAAQ